jgi:hypothetical protein
VDFLVCGELLCLPLSGLLHVRYAGEAQFSLEDIKTLYFRNAFPDHKLFNNSAKSSNVPGPMKTHIRNMYDNKCAVCQKPNNITNTAVTVAHIIKTPDQKSLERLGARKYNNLIMLCGTHGEKGTCHHLFDNFRMSFIHVPGGDMTQWLVVGGPVGMHGQQVCLPNAPPRRALHVHLAHCEQKGTLEAPREASVSDEDPLEDFVIKDFQDNDYSEGARPEEEAADFPAPWPKPNEVKLP